MGKREALLVFAAWLIMMAAAVTMGFAYPRPAGGIIGGACGALDGLFLIWAALTSQHRYL